MNNQINPSNIKFCGHTAYWEDDNTTFISENLIDKVVIEHILNQLGYEITKVEDVYRKDVDYGDLLNVPDIAIYTSLPKGEYKNLTQVS